MDSGIRWAEFMQPEGFAARVTERKGGEFKGNAQRLAKRAQEILEEKPLDVEDFAGGFLDEIKDPKLQNMMREFTALKMAQTEEIGDVGWVPPPEHARL